MDFVAITKIFANTKKEWFANFWTCLLVSLRMIRFNAILKRDQA